MTLGVPFTLAAVLLASVLLATPARAAMTRPVVDTRLANGLRVVVCPDPSSTDVAIEVRYGVGSGDEPGGLEGLAHLTEHAMFGASRHLARGAFWRVLESAGATDINGETSFDATVFHETVPPEALARALWVESERMGYLRESVDDASVARDRATIASEYARSISHTPLSSVVIAGFEELFPAWHPYHHEPIGALGSYERIEARDVRAFLGTWYGPANATLIVAGNVASATAIELATRYFATLPSRPPPVRPSLPPLQPLGVRTVRVEADVPHEELFVSWRTPAYGAAGDRELDVAAAVLQRALTLRMVGAQPVATGVLCREESLRQASVFVIRAQAAPGHHASELLTILDETIARLGREVDADERAAALASLAQRQRPRLDSNAVWASKLGLRASLGPLASELDGDATAWNGVTADAVRDVTRAYLGRGNRVVLLVDPTGWRPASGVVAHRGDGEP